MISHYKHFASANSRLELIERQCPAFRGTRSPQPPMFVVARVCGETMT
jgi:hypothetical protein